MRNRVFQTNRARNCQEFEASRKFRCTETERVPQLRSDEISTQNGESKSHSDQTQESPDKVESLKYAIFWDFEIATSSGLSHVPVNL